MDDFFKSIKAATEEAIAWKQGKETDARIHTFSKAEVDAIRKKTKSSHGRFS